MAADYQPRIRLPSYLRRAVATTAELPVTVDSVLTEPTSGTYTLTRPDGTDAVDAAATTQTGSVATYAVTLAASEALGEGWRESWALVFSGVTHTFVREAACVRSAPACEVSALEMRARHPELANQSTTIADDETAIEEAWISVQRWLIGKGRRPYLVIPSGALSEPVLLRALAIRFRNLSTFAGGSRYSELADYYDSQVMLTLDSLSLTYDLDDDGMPDAGEQNTSARSVLFLNAPPRGWWAG